VACYCRKQIDFADALHLAASKACSAMLTFDDRGYARRAKRLRLKPLVRVPTE
jgi:predicted nucleic-acid-binding protein